MPLDIAQIGIAVISVLVPFLIEMSKSAGKKTAEMLVEKGVEATASKGQAIWRKLTAHADTKGIVDTLARRPRDKKRQDIATEDLIAYLKKNPALAYELAELLGTQQAVQKIIADNLGCVDRATQDMEGNGEQIIESKREGKITAVHQIKRK